MGGTGNSFKVLDDIVIYNPFEGDKSKTVGKCNPKFVVSYYN